MTSPPDVVYISLTHLIHHHALYFGIMMVTMSGVIVNLGWEEKVRTENSIFNF